MGKLSTSQLVSAYCKKSFKECDLDGDGQIDAKELHVGLLLVYDKLNKSLPIHLQPPSHDVVIGLVRKYDADGTGHLNYEEFHECVTSVVGTNERAKWWDTLPFIVASRMLLKMAVLPLAALGLKALLSEVPAVKHVAKRAPNAAMVFAVEGIAKVGKVAVQKRTG